MPTGVSGVGSRATVTHVQSKASFIVPAYNEEFRIRGLLQTLTDRSIADRCSVFVICNGCTDRTNEVASEYLGVNVAVVATRGKHYALNEGDRLAADLFPRFYCDADVGIDVASVGRLIDYLEVDEPKVAGPHVTYGVASRPWTVRKYFAALEAVPVIAQWRDTHLSGRGIFGTNRAARAHFAEFPPLRADDMYFDYQFDAQRKFLVPHAIVKLDTPRSLRELIRNEARVVRANRELADFVQSTEPHEAAGDNPPSGQRDEPVVSTGRRIHHLNGITPSTLVPLAMYVFVGGTARAYLIVLSLRRKEVAWR
jgi:glycosyltransferase involved in cell wall biosynthesis